MGCVELQRKLPVVVHAVSKVDCRVAVLHLASEVGVVAAAGMGSSSSSSSSSEGSRTMAEFSTNSCAGREILPDLKLDQHVCSHAAHYAVY
jgi:hypothetical protein